MSTRPQQQDGEQGRIFGASAFAGGLAAVFTGGAAIPAFFTTFGISYALGQYGLARAARDWKQEVLERRITTRSAVEPHRVVYGQAMVSGNLVYAQVTGAQKEYLHMVIALAGHEIHSVDEIWFDEKLVGPRNVAGGVTSGNFANHAVIVPYLGTTSQAANATLVSASGGKWTSAHQGKGIAYLYIRLLFNEDIFAAGMPNVRALVRGKKVYDPRTATTAFSDNPALILRDYLTSDYGLGCTGSEIDDASVQTAADVCDQWVDTGITGYSVTVQAAADTFTTTSIDPRLSTGDRFVLGGTAAPTPLVLSTTYYLIRTGAKTLKVALTYQDAIEGVAVNLTTAGTAVVLNSVHQKRYLARGSFTLNQPPSEIEEQLRTCMAGSTIYTGGLWTIQAGAYAAPTVTLTAADLRGPVSVRPRQARSLLQNGVRGTYVDPTRKHVVTDYPPLSDATMVSQDGGDSVVREFDQVWCDNQIRAQRVGRIFLRRGRGAQLTLQCNLRAMKLRAGDTVAVTLDQLGYSAKPFRVVGWKLSGEDGVVGVNLALAEEDSSYYSWSSGDAVAPPLNDGVDVPDPYTVAAPTALACASGTAHLLKGSDGSIVSRIYVSWTKAVEASPRAYEIQWRKTTEADYNSAQVPADSAAYYIAPVEDALDYDVRVRTVATSGARSAWVVAVHTVVGKTAAPNPPLSLAVQPAPNGFDIAWGNPSDTDYAFTEVWEASSNDRLVAAKIADVAGTRLTRSGLPGGVARYYWIRTVDTTGNVSTWYPVGALAGVSATTQNANANQITHDSTSFLAGGATNYLTGTGYWLGYQSGAYKMHLGNPSGAYMAWDGSAFTVKGTTFTGDIQVDSAGNIRGGQTAYNTGTGFWLGYTGGAYKFSIGDPSGAYLRWTGTALEASGSIIDTRPYAAGTNVIEASYLAVYIIAEVTYRKYKAIRVARAGTVTVDFELVGAGVGFAAYARIYKNGVAVGTERTTTSTTWVAAADENISVAAGDTIELWAKMQNTSANGGIRNFRVMCDKNLGEAVVFEGGTVIWP